MKNVLLCCALAFLASSCKKENSDTVPVKNTSEVTLHLADGPGDYEAVNLDVQRVEFQHETGGTIAFTPIRAGIYNLLDLRNGFDALLSRGEMPPGKISQIRLILGSNNTIKVKGTTYPLTIPSGEQSGLKINVQEELKANIPFEIWLDVDAGRSIVETGSGKYMLKPVMRTYTSLTDGRIKGYIIPLPPATMIYAIKGSDTISAKPASDGRFMLCGLPEGNYKVWIDAQTGKDLELNNVAVSFGMVNDLGTLSLLP